MRGGEAGGEEGWMSLGTFWRRTLCFFVGSSKRYTNLEKQMNAYTHSTRRIPSGVMAHMCTMPLPQLSDVAVCCEDPRMLSRIFYSERVGPVNTESQ